MSDNLTVSTRPGATTPCMEWKDKNTGRTVFFVDAISAPQPKYTVIVTATLAQINAGLVIVPADPLRTITPTGFRLLITGNFATGTDVRLSDTNGTPVDIVTVLTAELTNGAIIGTGGGTGITYGAGFAAPLTAGAGVQIRDTGTAMTGGTSIQVMFDFILS
jgi:hypothetical protein